MENLIIPEITKSFEQFKINEFQSKNKSRVDERIDDKYIIYTGDKFDSKIKSGFSEAIYYSNSSFYVVKNYYSNGNIDIKGVRFNNGSEYGTWYKFNEEGEFVSEIDMVKDYDFGWKNILKYCDEHNIKLTKGYIGSGGIPTEIYKTELEDKKVWQITYFDKKAEKIFQIILDGKDGALLKKKEVELIGG